MSVMKIFIAGSRSVSGLTARMQERLRRLWLHDLERQKQGHAQQHS